MCKHDDQKRQIGTVIRARVFGISAACYAAPPNGIYVLLPHAPRHLPLRARLWVDFLKQRYADPAFWTQRVRVF